MVARSFQVRHNDSDFTVVYDTDDGLEVLKYQLFSLTSVPPDEQKIIGADDDRVVSDDSDLVAISEKLRLISISEEEPESTAGNEELLKSDEELARMLQAEEEALMYQQYAVPEDNGAFEQRVRPYVSQVLLYETEVRQEAARKTVPVEQLEEKALVSLAKEGNLTPSKNEQDHAFLLQLLFWFKQSFRWVNEPPCDGCGKKTISVGMDVALLHQGSRVEVYRCNSCPAETRFPRYNDPLKLLETRRGRCGEWANCFTLYCRAFGYESRLILDFTDHVWTECFSESLERWMHLDPCEGVYDKPLLYESGWNKKLNYVLAIGKDGVCDVTKRYTRKWHEVLSRRNIIAEPALSSVLANITKECRRGFTSQVRSALEDRDEKERQQLERDLHSTDDASTSLPGRRSGDKEWRKSRMEDGSDESFSLTGSSCPLRQCVDEHVTKIYNGFFPILSQLVNEGFPKSRAVEVLEILKEILINLKKSPFKTRRVSIDSVPNISQSVVQQLLPSFTELLSALSLSSKADTDGRVDIYLAGPPVKTSMALPVTFHALDVTIRSLKSCENFVKDSLCLPLLKLHRIHSGVVRASGEEIPFGIATSAFDGTRMSKWEEPNGAEGCWIIYKVSDNQMHELVAYELMSANDAPERDPMDWVVEGSNDGGSSWHVLDKQTSQLFDSRFQCRTFKVSSEGFLSNAFRFRFLRVRDIQSNSRLQLGSIDFYSRSS
ncbi:putative peptide-N(4)-(N-acetyl-beta-glucosaminyl)asparagine amidase [Rosa chinensis]|uniref:Putative peptide-N(4)-(N-acetyl-beta-glucosaminyl)asparagine amidase n=1 Tax=Rosa chinensis TaxID=74649 RepID=A0A2P6R604_ROSCH|nr:peptide-N(4)-(N-acetyl-beta-glucosaminyl)asparagine amidase [Rosa chinensis]PRQ41864.1 putative peptide-N(4)-(N-acetyl-beta-glucosaminyl)asparagine amidase [Rosa chinensis]